MPLDDPTRAALHLVALSRKWFIRSPQDDAINTQRGIIHGVLSSLRRHKPNRGHRLFRLDLPLCLCHLGTLLHLHPVVTFNLQHARCQSRNSNALAFIFAKFSTFSADVHVDSMCFDSTYSFHRAPHIIYVLVDFDPGGEKNWRWYFTWTGCHRL